MSAAFLNIFCDMTNKKIPNICQSKLKESKSTFIWMIHNFSDRRQNLYDFLESGIFTALSPSGDLVMWSLKLSRIYDGSSFFISIKPTFDDNISMEVSAKIKFMIRNSKGEDVTKLTIPNRIFAKGEYYQPPKNFIKRAELFDENNGFLPGDRLIIVFQVSIFKETVEMECGIVDEVPECNAVEEGMGNLLGGGLFTDCTLVAEDGTKFEVHKNILACRSPVFRAMFEHEMVEAKEGIANIKDIKSPVLDQMIQFMYNGKAPKLGEMAEELLQAAEMYQLDRLKMLFCERELIKSLRNENVLKRLALANKHSAKNLKTFAIKYIQMNAKEVMESDEWKMLIDGFGDVRSEADSVLKIFTSVAGTMAFSLIVYLVYNRITKGI